MNETQPFESREPPSAPKRNGPTPMLVVLSRVGAGRIPDQFAVELQRLVKEVAQTEADKAVGTLTLTVKVERPNAKQRLKGREIILSAKLDSKAPNDPPDATFFFFDDDGGLHDRDPYQGDMDRVWAGRDRD